MRLRGKMLFFTLSNASAKFACNFVLTVELGPCPVLASPAKYKRIIVDFERNECPVSAARKFDNHTSEFHFGVAYGLYVHAMALLAIDIQMFIRKWCSLNVGTVDTP